MGLKNQLDKIDEFYLLTREHLDFYLLFSSDNFLWLPPIKVTHQILVIVKAIKWTDDSFTNGTCPPSSFCFEYTNGKWQIVKCMFQRVSGLIKNSLFLQIDIFLFVFEASPFVGCFMIFQIPRDSSSDFLNWPIPLNT